MASLKLAIRAKCKDCTYDSACPGTYLQQIEECRVKACPLWPVRPMTVATVNANRKSKGSELDISAVLDSIDDEDDEECLSPNSVPSSLPTPAA